MAEIEKPSNEPSQPAQLLEFTELTTETPEQKLDKKVYQELGKYEGRFKEAKNSEEAEKVVEEARKKLEDALNGNKDLLKLLPGEYSKKYENVFSENWDFKYGRDWHIVVKKEDNKFKVEKYFHPWDKDTGYSP